MEKEDNIKLGVPQGMREMIGKKPPCVIKMELHQCVQDTNDLALMFASLFSYSKLEQVSYDKLNSMRITVRQLGRLLRKEYSDFFGDKKEESEEESPKSRKLSEITREFRSTLWVGARKYKNEFSLFWKDWKDERGLLTRDAYGKIQPDGGPHWRLNNDVWKAFERLNDVLESLMNYFESVEKYNENYTNKSILLQIRQMDRDRIHYALHEAEMELQLLKMNEPLEEERKEGG